ncbi:MAG: dTDP-4-dehydrorhamnose reductase [Permianibacter sp.]
MRVLVTGAAGQLGRSIAKLCNQSPHTIMLLDRSELDITVTGSIEQALNLHRPDVLINTAAYTAVDRAESEVELSERVNHQGPHNLARACAQRQLPLLHVSTDYVFDGQGQQPYTPEYPAQPLGVYGASKWRGEEAVRQHCRKHLVVRTAWVFSEFANNFLKTMLRLGVERESLYVVADQQGGPTYAPHLAAALLSMAEQASKPEFSAWGTYHFAGEPATTWYAFACEIFRQAVASGVLSRAPQVQAIPTSAYPTPAKRPAYSVLDCQRTLQVFGVLERRWQIGIEEALKTLSPLKQS